MAGEKMLDIKKKITCLAAWAEANHMALIYLGGAWILLFFTLWSGSLLFGLWANALFGLKFELSVGMTGIGTIATAGATVYGIARAAQEKYLTDSRFNSPPAKKPLCQDILQQEQLQQKGGTKE